MIRIDWIGSLSAELRGYDLEGDLRAGVHGVRDEEAANHRHQRGEPRYLWSQKGIWTKFWSQDKVEKNKLKVERTEAVQCGILAS